MIGQASWFQRRKYSGWGLTPKTWQGWVYILILALLSFSIYNFPGLAQNIRTLATYIFISLICLDLLHIMATLKKDEFEFKVEAIAERNAAWTMIVVISIGIAYQAAQSTISGISQVDVFLLATLVGGVIAKSITNIWLEKKGI